MRFRVFTLTPPRAALLGTVPAKWTCDDADDVSAEAIVERVHVPLGGEVVIVPVDAATVVRTRVVNEVAP